MPPRKGPTPTPLKRSKPSGAGEKVDPAPLPLVTAANSQATNTDHNNGPKVSPSKTMLTLDKRWVSQDLDLLRSGLFADAEVVCCEENAAPRKVHRSILSARSAWFKKAFSGSYKVSKLLICWLFVTDISLPKQERDGKVVLQATTWQVDLILYFFYSGGIDMTEKALTGGHDVMTISIELVRLGNYFESGNMRDYGAALLASYLGDLLDHTCDTNVTEREKRWRFLDYKDFSKQLCAAVRSAYDTERPAKPVQGILADFAFAARMHLFKNTVFEPFITSNQVPEFGNLVLAAQMNGGVSGAFKDNDTFKKWKDWELNPSKGPST